jgi:hypothetical protein
MVIVDSPFFIITPASCVLPLAQILPREAPDPARVRRALALMHAAAHGVHPRRPPITVKRLGIDCYKIVDGNSTFYALLELGESEAIVRIS